MDLENYPDLKFERGDVLVAEYDGRFSGAFAPLDDGDRVLVLDVVEDEDGFGATPDRLYKYVICGEEEVRTMRIRAVGGDGTRWSYSHKKAHAPFQMRKVEG